ncbi:hypothetical protein D1007_62400 [Hordeum vulgare]|nr:hypothetical protein D1007_62400 [Hordeum vulgare]
MGCNSEHLISSMVENSSSCDTPQPVIMVASALIDVQYAVAVIHNSGGDSQYASTCSNHEANLACPVTGVESTTVVEQQLNFSMIDGDSGVKQTKQVEYEVFIGCNIPTEIVIHPPTDVRMVGRCKRIKVGKKTSEDEQKKKKKEAKVPGITDLGLMPRKVSKVAIVGGGLMCSGIATVLILSHYHVILKEVDEKFLNAGMDRIKGVPNYNTSIRKLAESCEERKMTSEKSEKTLSLLTALLLVDHGMDVYKIDQVCTEFGMPIGPFRYEGKRKASPDLEIMNYVEESRRIAGATPDPELLKLDNSTIAEMVLFRVINEACRVLGEGITFKASNLNIASIFGMGFPPYKCCLRIIHNFER